MALPLGVNETTVWGGRRMSKGHRSKKECMPSVWGEKLKEYKDKCS